jgi:ATP-dependent Clp protease adapter protein ClpS
MIMKKTTKEAADKSVKAKKSFKVFLHNDDTTTMELVVFVLTSIFDKSEEQARTIMMQVHNEGLGMAGAYSLETARSKASAVKLIARAQGFPLKCTIEDQEDGDMPKRATRHQLPPGWIMAGTNPEDYEVAIDTTVSHSGTQCARVKDATQTPRGFGTLMQMFSPDDHLNKRLRMRMWVKTDDVQGWVQPWMRVDGTSRRHSLSFDNCCERKILGTTDWAEHEIVLDVPEESTNIAFGIMLSGTGKLWMDDITFVEVGAEVPATDCPCNRHKRANKKKAANLNFEEN